MFSLTAPPQEPMTNMPEYNSLYSQEETDARYIQSRHHQN